jgi:hypothetical protein
MVTELLAETLIKNGLNYVRNSGLPVPLYMCMLPQIRVYRALFRFKYMEKVEDPKILKRLLHLESLVELQKYSDTLDAWLTAAMGDTIRLDWIPFTCPECLNVVVQDKPEEGDKVCLSCGLVIDASYDETIPMDESLDRDVTMQPTSRLDFRDGLGNTIKSQNLHRLLDSPDSDFSAFKESQPQLASDLYLFGFALKEGFCYRLLNGYVRKVPIAEVDNLFNQQDKPLRKYKLGQQNDAFTVENKAIFTYASQLCIKYGVEDKTFKDSLGIKIRSMRITLKFLGNSRPRLKPIADTAFYLCLLDFKKKAELDRAEPYLKVDANIFNLIGDWKLFKINHAKPNYDRTLLEAYKKRSLEVRRE